MKLIYLLLQALLLIHVLVVADASLFRHGTTLHEKDSPDIGLKTEEEEYVLTNLDTTTNTRPNELVDIENPAAGDSPPRGPDDLNSGLGCSVQCIKSGVAYARGVNAELRVTTDTNAQISLSISTPTGLIGPFWSGAGQRSFSKLFSGLEPGTTYLGLTSATDDDGNTAYAQGEFTTLVRNVEIHMDPAYISYKLVANVDYDKQVWVNGAWVPSEEDYNMVETGTGPWFLDFDDDTVFLSNMDRYLEFIVQLRMFNLDGDTSDEIFGSPCEAIAPLTEPFVGSISGSCSYFAFVELEEGVFDLDDRPAYATSWVEHQYSRELVKPFYTHPSVQYFVFSVFADIYVRYEPA